MKVIYVVLDENRIILGVFRNRKEAQCWANRINDYPTYDGLARAEKYYVAPTGWIDTDDGKDCFNAIILADQHFKITEKLTVEKNNKPY